MTSPSILTSEEKIIVALASLLGILFLLFAPHTCKPGATALSLSPGKNTPQETPPSNSSKATSSDASDLNNRNEAPLVATSAQTPLADSPVLSRSSSQPNTLTNPSSSSRKEQEPQTFDPTRNVLTNSGSPSTDPLPSNSLNSEQASRLIDQAQKNNEKFLQQIKELATESNALKDERREREAKFAETKNEYAATLKFARAQYQEKLLTLEKKNKQLSQELAGNSKDLSPEGVPDQETPQEDTTDSTNKESPESTENPETPNFAQNDEDLDESRRTLVTAIRDMDILSGDALAARYQALENQLNSKSAGRIHFLSGSSQASASEISRIEAIAGASNPKSEFLIAGFADRSGSANGNRSLSSKRAKFVAEQLAKKVGNGRVQAIYLGQTAPFGPAAENRVVEIWEITPAISQ